MSIAAETEPERWVDIPTAAAITGLRRTDLVWAVTSGEIRMSTVQPGHVGIPMVDLGDVEWVAGRLGRG